MTDEQRQQLLDTVSDIVGEHCKSWLFVAEVEDTDPGEEPGAATVITDCDGGLVAAFGLHEMARRWLHRTQSDAEMEEAMDKELGGEEDGSTDALA